MSKLYHLYKYLHFILKLIDCLGFYLVSAVNISHITVLQTILFVKSKNHTVFLHTYLKLNNIAIMLWITISYCSHLIVIVKNTNQTIVIKTILLCVKIVICKFQNTFRKAKHFESAQRPYAKRWGLTSQLEKFIEIELTIIVLFCFHNHISRVLGFEYFLFI